MKKGKTNNLYSKAKSFKKRLSFAFHKKGFLKSNRHIEILYLEGEKPVKKKIKLKKPTIYTGLSLSALAVLLLVFSFTIGVEGIKTGTRQFLAGLGIYTEEIKSVEIESNDYDSPGSWHIDKSAKWIGEGKAEITFEVSSIVKESNTHYKDIILVLDVSGSMEGERLEDTIKDSKDLIDKILSDNHNRVAIITFDNTANIVSSFTNNKVELYTKLDLISASNGATSYHSGLSKIDDIMNGYHREENKDVVALFLTDGFPTKDISSQKAMYQLLKEKYPYMAIHGIQYEMGLNVINELSSVTDRQWATDQSSLKNALIEAALTPVPYEIFIMTDEIGNDFEIENENKIKKSIGNVSLTEESGTQKIIWNLGNSFVSGTTAKLTVEVSLKENPELDTFYPISKKETIIYQLSSESQKEVNSNDVPVLKSNYEVIYEANMPSSCPIEYFPKEKYFAYQSVTKKTQELSCDGYIFKGWEIDEEEGRTVNYINEDTFIMPPNDIHIRATWTKQTMSKNVEGTVFKRATLYRVLESEAKANGLAREYIGGHQDSMNASASTKKIYHWYVNNSTEGTQLQDKYNVIFADHCWMMIRTTDTGGVKLLYNGEVENGQCLSTRGSHMGIGLQTYTLSLNNVWFGTDFIYNKETKEFTISGETEQSTWNDANYEHLIGKYTCNRSVENATCSTLYMVRYYASSTQAKARSLNSESNYNQFGGEFYQYDPDNIRSLSDVGYMRGDTYKNTSVPRTQMNSFSIRNDLLESSTLNADYLYSKEIQFDGSSYSLVNPILGSDIPEDNYVGYYTFKSSTIYSGTSIYFIGGFNSNNNNNRYYYCVKIEAPNQPSDYYLLIGDNYIDNLDGTYTITDTTLVSLDDYYINYANYKKKYTCGDASTTTCTNLRYIYSTNSFNYNYINMSETILIAKERNGTSLIDTLLETKYNLIINPDNYSDYKYTCYTNSSECTEENLSMIDKIGGFFITGAINHYYGTSVTWDGTSYTLVNPIEMENYDNMEILSSHHFLCQEPGAISCSSVAYIFDYFSSSFHTLILNNGITSVEQVLEDMLEKNESDSSIKSVVDKWYEHFMLDYDEYLEDTIFCNDRTIASMGAFEQNSGPLIGEDNITKLFFKGHENHTDLSCSKTTDRFSIYNNQAKLKYKVAIITLPEVLLLNKSEYFGSRYLMMTPSSYRISSGLYCTPHIREYSGSIIESTTSSGQGVRPVVSLKPGLEYMQGDGSREDPYVVDTDTD